MRRLSLVIVAIAWVAIVCSAAASAQEAVVSIPKIDHPLRIEAFEAVDYADVGPLAHITGYRQRAPHDDEPVTEPTDAYLAHDGERLYIVVVAGYRDPSRMRAHLVRREDNESDDFVNVLLDTSNDQRRGYMFGTNAYGIQWDALWTEGQGYDKTVDFLWETTTRRTANGYVAMFSIPFSSLRFPDSQVQEWRLMLGRGIQSADDESFWPRFSTRVEGRLNQAGVIRLTQVTGGHGYNIIPSVISHAQRSRSEAGWSALSGQVDASVDAKAVFRDRIVVDATVNPDFGQVESDEPQVTVNQRFEVFYPEKRPFFLENASYFQTPINLVFTRRIEAPTAGVRLTTKTGPYAVGAMLVGDDPVSGEDGALFAIARVSRDVFHQGSLGALITHRAQGANVNDVAGIDGRLKLNANWTTLWQVARSQTAVDGRSSSGSAWQADVNRAGRSFTYKASASGRSPDFLTEVGYSPRADVIHSQQEVSYRFRPESGALLAWGPTSTLGASWDYDGTRLEWSRSYGVIAELRRQTSIAVTMVQSDPTLRPKDVLGLAAVTTFSTARPAISVSSTPSSSMMFTLDATAGTDVNYVPALGQLPTVVNFDSIEVTGLVRAGRQLSIQSSYLFTQLARRETGESVLTNHLVRTRWHLQLSSRTSVRAIVRYERTVASASLTSAPGTGNVNADVLFTWMLNPWTALYAGYNGNATEPSRLGGVRQPFRRDADQLFVKLSYLWRP